MLPEVSAYEAYSQEYIRLRCDLGHLVDEFEFVSVRDTDFDYSPEGAFISFALEGNSDFASVETLAAMPDFQVRRGASRNHLRIHRGTEPVEFGTRRTQIHLNVRVSSLGLESLHAFEMEVPFLPPIDRQRGASNRCDFARIVAILVVAWWSSVRSVCIDHSHD